MWEVIAIVTLLSTKQSMEFHSEQKFQTRAACQLSRPGLVKEGRAKAERYGYKKLKIRSRCVQEPMDDGQ